MVLFIMLGACSQYDVMYTGQLPNRQKNVDAVAAAQSPWGGDMPPTLAKPQIRGDCEVELWVSEVQADPKAVRDRLGEYIELYNPSSNSIRLNGWRLSDMNQDTHTVQATRPIVIQGHGYLVLGVNSNSSTNGGILVDYQYQHFNLSNREDQVRLEDACGNLVDEFAYPGPRGWPKVRAGVAMERVGSKNLKKGVGWKRVRARLQSGDRGNPGQGPWPIQTERKKNHDKNKKEEGDAVARKSVETTTKAPRGARLLPTPWPPNATKQTTHRTND